MKIICWNHYRKPPSKKAVSKAHKTIQERFKDFDGECEPINIDWGDPVGDEI